MTRTELLLRLESEPVSSGACFVLLWTYLDQARVSAGENRSREMGVHPFRIEPHLPAGRSLRERLIAAVREIRTLKGDRFELYALRWLMALDRLFDQRQGGQLEEGWISSLDGMEYRVRRRNNFLADSFTSRVTSQADQSGSRDLYARFHIAVPKAVQGISIEIRPEEGWAEPALRSRLTREKTRFRVMLWPLQTILDYTALSSDSTPSDFISLDRIRNEEELRSEIQAALATARDQEVSLLIFPELAIPPATRADIQLTLKDYGSAGHPLLTLLGCCHRQLPDGAIINEAVLLGPNGSELHCHQKLASFTKIITRDRARICGEPIRVGTRVSVLESALGNLMPLICLDFIHEPLRQVVTSSHANLFAVPSLSHTTVDHRNRAENLLRTNLGGSFVSNRALEGITEKATSFFLIPNKDGLQTHLPQQPAQPDTRYLLFSLQDALTGQDK